MTLQKCISVAYHRLYFVIFSHSILFDLHGGSQMYRLSWEVSRALQGGHYEW